MSLQHCRAVDFSASQDQFLGESAQTSNEMAHTSNDIPIGSSADLQGLTLINPKKSAPSFMVKSASMFMPKYVNGKKKLSQPAAYTGMHRANPTIKSAQFSSISQATHTFGTPTTLVSSLREPSRNEQDATNAPSNDQVMLDTSSLTGASNGFPKFDPKGAAVSVLTPHANDETVSIQKKLQSQLELAHLETSKVRQQLAREQAERQSLIDAAVKKVQMECEYKVAAAEAREYRGRTGTVGEGKLDQLMDSLSLSAREKDLTTKLKAAKSELDGFRSACSSVVNSDEAFNVGYNKMDTYYKGWAAEETEKMNAFWPIELEKVRVQVKEDTLHHCEVRHHREVIEVENGWTEKWNEVCTEGAAVQKERDVLQQQLDAVTAQHEIVMRNATPGQSLASELFIVKLAGQAIEEDLDKAKNEIIGLESVKSIISTDLQRETNKLEAAEIKLEQLQETIDKRAAGDFAAMGELLELGKGTNTFEDIKERIVELKVRAARLRDTPDSSSAPVVLQPLLSLGGVFGAPDTDMTGLQFTTMRDPSKPNAAMQASRTIKAVHKSAGNAAKGSSPPRKAPSGIEFKFGEGFQNLGIQDMTQFRGC